MLRAHRRGRARRTVPTMAATRTTPEELPTVTQQEIPLLGGNTSTVVRAGDTVRRNVGPWTPSVHALLRHLEYVGFTGAPRALGIDERGREVLSYLEGECGEYPLAPHWVTDEALVTVATMLRMFHDAQYGFRPVPGAVWRSFGPPPPDTEVICHHDAAPHNVIWRPDGTLALIDFDLASPGARIYDVAYAAWTWVPLFSDRDSYTLGWKRPNRPRRLRLFADAYGLTPRDRQRVIRRSSASCTRDTCAGRSVTCGSSTTKGTRWSTLCADEMSPA